MPELPEVESVARSLRAALLGRRLDAIAVRWAGSLKPSPRAVRAALIGKRLLAVHRHGKYLFLDFGARSEGPAERQLLLHLRMTGQLFTDPVYRPDKHLRLRLDFEGQPVFYRNLRKFGGFALLEGLPGGAAPGHRPRRDDLPRLRGLRGAARALPRTPARLRPDRPALPALRNAHC